MKNFIFCIALFATPVLTSAQPHVPKGCRNVSSEYCVSPSHYYVLPLRDYVIKAGDTTTVVTNRTPTNYGGGGPDSSEVTITFFRPRNSDRQQDFIFKKSDTLQIGWYYEKHIDDPRLKYADPEKLEQIYLLKDGAELRISNFVIISGKFANRYAEVYQERFNGEESNYLMFGRYAQGRTVNALEVNDAIVFTWEYSAITIYGKDTTIAITADPNTKFLFSGQLHILNNTGKPLVLKKGQHYKIMEVNSEPGYPCETGGGSAPTTNALFQMSPDWAIQVDYRCKLMKPVAVAASMPSGPLEEFNGVMTGILRVK